MIAALRRLLALVLLLSLAAQAEGPSTPGELLVRWAPGARRPADVVSALDGLLSVSPLLPTTGAAPRRAAAGPLAGWHRLRFDDSVDLADIEFQLQRNAAVAAVQPNYLRRHVSYRSDDPQLDEQWSLDAIGWRDRDPGRATGVIVAIIDSGIDTDHPDLAPQLWHNQLEQQGQAGVDDDGNGYVDDTIGWDFTDAPGLPGNGDYLDPDSDPQDESGHGTHVAGIVGAVTDNGIGVAGVAPGVSLMALRAGFNIGSGGYLQDDDVAAAIIYAADNGAHIINLSLGDPRYSPLMDDAVEYATQRDIVVVAAVGNEASTDVFYPARLSQTIGVAAAGRDGRPVSFSNRGASVDLLAPGLAVLSTRPDGQYGESSGTSMAAPHVAAAAALMRARFPQYTRQQVLGALTAAAVDVGPTGWDERSGHGLLQLSSPAAGLPLVVTIEQPRRQPVVAADTVWLSVDVEAPLGARVELSVGAGIDPQDWELLAATEVSAPGRQIRTPWVPSGDDGAARHTLRAFARDSASWHEDRVIVYPASAAVAVSNVRTIRALQGARWRTLVEWRTEPAAPSQFELSDSERQILQLRSAERRVDHRISLPDDLPAGRYGVQMVSGSARFDVDSLVVVPSGVTRWDLAVLGPQRDNGYLLPTLSDLTGDGRDELAAMIFGGGAYGVTQFFDVDQARPVFTSTQLYIPWHIGDVDVDGRPDLLAVDARRVRLFETTTGRFPERAVWEADDVWGGEVYDLDGDARPELILRSATGAQFRVFESTADNAISETAVFVNDTDGDNEMGDRQTVGDLDGDGRGEWISGDADGDLFAVESVGDDAYRRSWTDVDEAEHVDGRLLSPAADLDGDGVLEFVSGRLNRDPIDVEGRRWTVTVYSAASGDSLEAEWTTQVVAGAVSGNGINIIDVDGDGQLEFVAVLRPHLYVFRYDGDGYQPVWYASASATQRPAVGDLDGDGRQEFVFNDEDGALTTRRWIPPAGPLLAPGSWQAAPAGADRVRLAWDAVDGAVGYRIRRDGEVIAQPMDVGLQQYVWVDSSLSGATFAYDVAAIDSSGTAGHHSPALRVQPAVLPRLIDVRRTSARQLSLSFDRAMVAGVGDPHRYRLEPALASVRSATPSRSGLGAIISFDADLPDVGDVVVHVSGLRAVDGAPLTSVRGLQLSPVIAPTRLLQAVVVDSLTIRFLFDRPIMIDGGSAIVDGGRLRVADVRPGDQDASVDVRLATDTPLLPLGRDVAVQLSGVIDDLQRPVPASAVVRLAATDLAGVRLFPNPLRPGQQELTVAGLPLGAKVRIFSLAGELVWSGNEADGDGGLQWTGRNGAGRQVAAGLYVVVASHDGNRRRLRVAVIP